MKNCTKCIYAKWEKTKSGGLHPSGGGRCTKEIIMPEFPASMYWLSNPHISHGFISRHKELKDHCVYYAEVVK
jgi:hypothetical protein